jgi:hypothetical protein
LVAAIVGVAALADLAVRLPPASVAAALTVVGALVLVVGGPRLVMPAPGPGDATGSTGPVDDGDGDGNGGDGSREDGGGDKGDRTGPDRPPLGTAGWGAVVLVVVLAAGLVVRASPWAWSSSLAAAAALVALLAAGGLDTGTRRPWARAVQWGLYALIDSVGWLPILATAASGGERARATNWLRVGLVVLVVAGLLVPLLASGDPVFGSVVTLGDPASWLGHVALTAALVVPVAALALLATRLGSGGSDGPPSGAGSTGSSEDADDPAEDADDPAAGGERRAEPVPTTPVARFALESRAAVWTTAAVLAIWCVVQVVVVSGGAEAVLEAEGLTPAQYAREGFFQLVVAAAVSLGVLNLAHRLSRTPVPDSTPDDGDSAPGPGRPAGAAVNRPDPGQRLPAVIIGVALVVLITASFSRLWFYVGVFGLTMLRLAVATFLVWLVVMTALSVARAVGLGPGSNWLPMVAVLTAAVGAVGFAAADPEAVVARVNLDRALASDEVDINYLTTLSADVEPVLAAFDWDLLGGQPEAVTTWLCDQGGDSAGYGPLGWNWSRHRARPPGPGCPSAE